MNYDDEKYLNDEEDNDLWDDELEIYDTYPSHNDDKEYDDEKYEEENEVGSSYETEEKGEKDDVPDDYYSEPETQPETKPKREGFFRKKAEADEDENDYFDSDDEPTPTKKPKTPKLDPEDPDYWIEEEASPLENIIHKPGKTWKWWLAGAVSFLILLIFSWVWFLRPYSDNAIKYGYIINMERRGSIIKTFEGTLIPYKELGDPEPLHFKKVAFSVESDSLAAVMKRMMLGCIPVRVEYEMYHTALPWKGKENVIIVKADSTDPRKILPPEYRYND